jgi:hypothetical protein
MLLACAVVLQDKQSCLAFALIACSVHNFGRTLGEATINGYIKAIP